MHRHSSATPFVPCSIQLDFGSEESRLMVVCYAVSEPVVAPVRNMLDRVPGIRDMGIDFSFMATYLLLEIVRLLLLSFA